MTTSVLDHPIFRGAEAEAVAEIVARVHPRWVPRGTTLATPGAGSRSVLLVLEGQLRSFLLTADGRRVILEMVGAGGIDGLIPMIGLSGHFTEAAERSLVASLSPNQLDRLVRADPTIAVNMVGIATARLATRESQLETLAVRDPARRIASQLLQLARASGGAEGDEPVRLRQRVTHQVIADMSGIRRETVTLHLQRLAQAGAVDGGNDEMTVVPSTLAGIVAGSVRLAARRGRNGNGAEGRAHRDGGGDLEGGL